MIRLPLTLRQATLDERDLILDLIEETARWLQAKGTDQWSKPWPNEEGRNQRVIQDLAAGRTWLAFDEATAAGTITIDPSEDSTWPEAKRREKAVYVRRVIVRRRYAGLELGARLLDWAGEVAARTHGAHWIRLDVWTTNRRLHAYYRGQGFKFSGLRDLIDGLDHPSRVLFERSSSRSGPGYHELIKPVQAHRSP